MESDQNSSEGLALDEAAKRLIPDEWTAWQNALANARRVGSPGRRIVSNIDGPIAPSPEYAKKKRAQNQLKAVNKKLRAGLIDAMCSGAYAAFGRPQSPTADRREIKSDQWRLVRQIDALRSSISFGRAGADVIHAVRVWHVFDLPDAAKRLADLSLVQIFRRFVLEDLELRNLESIAKDAAGECELIPRLDTGWFSQLSKYWPITDASLSQLGMLKGSPLGMLRPPPSEAVVEFKLAVIKRFCALMELLRTGALVGYGHTSNGTLEKINAGIWERAHILCDFTNGDVGHFVDPDDDISTPRFEPMWLAVELRLPDIQSIAKNSQLSDGHESQRKRKSRVLSPAQQAIREAVADLFPNGIQVGLRVKERDEQINRWLQKNGHSRCHPKTIQRYFAKTR